MELDCRAGGFCANRTPANHDDDCASGGHAWHAVKTGAMTEQITDSFEVSPQQEQLWLAQPDGPSGRLQATFALDGALQANAVAAALQRATLRHEILRTTFVRQPGIRVPLQAIAEELAPAWSSATLAELTGEAQDVRLAALAREQLQAPFDPAHGPLLRALLVALGDDRHALVLTISSLCADASSLSLLGREIFAHLTGAVELAAEPLQYADFAAWQRELQASDDEEALRAREFWTEAAGASSPALAFPPDSTSPSGMDSIDVALDATQVASLRDLAVRYGADLNAVAHAAWHAVLAASAPVQEVTTALLSCVRRHDDLDGAIGAFVAPVPVATRTASSVTFAELVQDIAHRHDEAAVWQDYAPGAAPAVRIGVLQAESLELQAGGLQLSLIGVQAMDTGLGVWLTTRSGADTLAIGLGYDPAYMTAAQARRLAERVSRLLASASEQGGVALGELTLLPESERRLLLEKFARGGPGLSALPVHERFAAHAASAPERLALSDGATALTYAELDRRANQLGQRLRRLGVGPDVVVGLCTDRSVDMIVGLLGILKAGGAYLPLHYDHPRARTDLQLRSVGARVLVTQEPLLTALPTFAGETLCLDRDRSELEREESGAPEVTVAPENLVYVIYTSGSTGTPKGVAVTHGNLANYASFIAARLGAEERPLSFGLVTSISTDLGNTSVFGALASGGSLVLLSATAAADAGAFAAQLQRTPIDVLKITPSHIGALTAGGDARVLPREWLVIGGERAPWDLVVRLRGLAGCRILNHYGPTEATVGCATHLVPDRPGEYAPATVPLGRPIDGDACYVLDDLGRPAPLGTPGRLHIGGAGVAQGYIGAPELTDERFLPDPHAGVPGARMYDTGDLARWLPDGTLEFLGRVDEQVKIRGYRVEPAEVESALRTYPGIRDAVVLARAGAGAGADDRLIAYCATDDRLDSERLRAHLADWLPEFMVPSAFVTLVSLPRTASGKVDRLALPDPEEPADAETEYVAPRTPVEQALAEIWAHVLGVERVGVQEDFFALGGHSLLATQVVAQVRSDFAVDLPLHSLFTFPTVTGLSEELVRLMGSSEEDETARLMAELEGLSEEDAERLLAGESKPPDA